MSKIKSLLEEKPREFFFIQMENKQFYLKISGPHETIPTLRVVGSNYASRLRDELEKYASMYQMLKVSYDLLKHEHDKLLGGGENE